MTFFCACLLLSAATSWAAVSEQLGNFVSLKKSDHGVVFVAANARVSLTVYRPDIVRLRAAKDEFSRDFSYAVVHEASGNFSEIQDGPAQVVLKTSSLTVIVTKSPLRFHFYRDGKLLNEDDAHLGITWQGTSVSCFKRLFQDERFLGLGEKTGRLDRRGRSFVNWNTDHYAYGTEDDPLYSSIPFFIGLHDHSAYGVFLDNTSRTTFDFGASTDNERFFFSAAEGEMNYYFFAGTSPAGIIEGYTYLTGRMPLPPLWGLGYQQCRWSYYPDREVINLARTFREKKIPADVIYLDIHYMDSYKIFTWNPERFPDPARMIDTLKRWGFHLVTIVDPGIKVEPGYFAYDEGSKNDFFLKYPDGSFYVGSVWPGRCHFPDFTKDAARLWWGKNFQRLISPGVEGFWNDMNEPAVWGQHVPDLVECAGEVSPMTMSQAHNIYGLEMARSTYEGAKSLMNGRRPFVLTRAGYAGVQRFSAVWTGDNVPSDDHMLLAVRMVNSMGISGVAFAGPDIGGFSGDATPELFLRWLSIGTFTPFFRNHKEYAMKRQEPWSFGEEVEAASRRVIGLRYELLPYVYSTFYQTTLSGMPVARSLALDSPFDEHIYWEQFQQEYLFGDNMLVAPVASTEKLARVYFPAGSWYRLSTEQVFKGGQDFIVDAPLNDLPVFVRAGAIIPMQPVTQYSLTSSDTLKIHVYDGPKSSFLYYEDDGVSVDYSHGMFYMRKISFDPSSREIVFDGREGSFTSRFAVINLCMHQFEGIRNISVNHETAHYSTGPLNVRNLYFRNADSRIIVHW